MSSFEMLAFSSAIVLDCCRHRIALQPSLGIVQYASRCPQPATPMSFDRRASMALGQPSTNRHGDPESNTDESSRPVDLPDGNGTAHVQPRKTRGRPRKSSLDISSPKKSDKDVAEPKLEPVNKKRSSEEAVRKSARAARNKTMDLHASDPSNVEDSYIPSMNNFPTDTDTDPSLKEEHASAVPAPMKRGRGRPKGAVGWKKRMPKAKTVVNRDGTTKRVGTAPNGMQGRDGEPLDFFPELISIFAKKEMEEQAARPLSEEDKNMRDLVSMLRSEHLSRFHESGSFSNLKPFKEKADKVKQCQTCSGEGMMTCEFCKGECFVDKDRCGPPGTVVKTDFGEAVVPDDNAFEDSYRCPFCGGLGKERCIDCLGRGSVSINDGTDVATTDFFSYGAIGTLEDGRALGWADRDTYIRDNRDRIDIGVDGTIILRRRARRRKKKEPDVSSDATDDINTNASEGEAAPTDSNGFLRPQFKRSRGRPRKGQRPEDIFPMGEADQERLRQVSDARNFQRKGGIQRGSLRKGAVSTDFFNSSDYKMGLRLRKARGTIGEPGAHDTDNNLTNDEERFGDDNTDETEEERELDFDEEDPQAG